MDKEQIQELGKRLIESPAEAIVYSDNEGIIQVWNKGAERLFGYTASEATGQSLDIIIPPKLRARHWEGYNRVMAGGETRYGAGDLLSVPGQTRNEERISLEFTVIPYTKDGRIMGMMAVIRDVTARWNELKSLREQINKLRWTD